MTNSLDVATAVSDAGPGRFGALVDPQWSVAGRTNGGYLLALLGRAAAATSPRHPDVVGATATYLSPVPPGAVELVVEVLREGRSTSVLRVRPRPSSPRPVSSPRPGSNRAYRPSRTGPGEERGSEVVGAIDTLLRP